MTTEFNYSVRVKNGAGWRAFNRMRLMISVGQPYHEGRKLQAVVDWLNRNTEIREVHVSVNDLLQRHNYMADGMSEREASAAAVAEGTLWIERNADTLSGIKATASITRWAEWLGHPDFPPTSNALAAYADADALLEEALHADAHTLADRRTKRGEAVPNYDRLVAHSHDYVGEELPVFAIQCRELPAAEVYPGSNLTSAQYLVGKKLPEPIAPLAGRHFTRIDFDRINVTSPPTSHRGQRVGLASRKIVSARRSIFGR
jgi:tRNA-dependent cyclodipeptide synthase